MLLKNKDSSFLTQQRQNRAIYADYIAQKQRVDSGCLLHVNLENGSTGEASILTKIKLGELDTTTTSRDLILSNTACPTIAQAQTQAPVNPYASDNIYLSLTTSASSYSNASIGSWVPVTASEYSAIQNNVSNTTVAGLSSNLFATGTYSGGFTQLDFFAANTSNATLTPTIPANYYFYAFAIIIRSPLNITMSNLNVYTNNSATTFSNFTQKGSSLPSVVGGKNYYVLKGVSAVNAATDGVIGVSAPDGDPTPSNNQSFQIGYSSSSTGTNFRYNNGVTLPITSSTSMPSFAGANWSIGIQGLTSPSIQWVT